MLNSFQRSSFRQKFSSFSRSPFRKNFDQEIDMIAIYERVTNKQPKRTGKGWIGKCPFPDHQDRTPSFVMWPCHNQYKCYGCQKTGTASWFKHEMDRIFGNGPVAKEDQ